MALHRWLCRIGLHARAASRQVAGTCRRETRCHRCDRLLKSVAVHDWVIGTTKNARCAGDDTCRRCAETRIAFRHRNESEVVGCDLVTSCLDCGYRHVRQGQVHDEEEEWPYTCRRCGHFYDDGDA
ncbi:hypothetical protein [Actinoplanes subglobosus]|uniref:Uncharacterized protein n=1 Tax=Actinoplanes subglobosus TaxID=1547892 RepID=A0ABV8IQT4_9ACTN